MKTLKIIFITFATFITAAVSSAFLVPALSENTISVKIVDGQHLDINLAPVQIKGLYALLPAQYKEMTKTSYAQFRSDVISGANSFIVDGISVSRSNREDGEYCLFSGVFDILGRHDVLVNLGSMDTFLATMNSIITE